MNADGWLFPGQTHTKPISTRQLSRVVEEAAKAAQISKHVSPHTLRHNSERLIIPSAGLEGAGILEGFQSYSA